MSADDELSASRPIKDDRPIWRDGLDTDQFLKGDEKIVVSLAVVTEVHERGRREEDESHGCEFSNSQTAYLVSRRLLTTYSTSGASEV